MPRKIDIKLRGIYENPLGSGCWWIQYFDASGRRRREKAGRRSDAIELLAKRKTEKLQRVKLPENLRKKPISFAELMDDAIEHSKAENGERSTAELKLKYDTLRPVFGHRPAIEVTKQEIVRWLTSATAQRGWASATKNRWQAAFSLAFRVGIDNEKIDRNSAARIRRKTEDNGRIRFLSNTEEVKLRRVLAQESPRHVLAFDVSLHTGMRAGEQFSMKWNQIDWERRILTVPKSKNGHARHIPLNSIAFSALQTLKKHHPRSPWVFLNRQAEKLRGPRDWFEPAVRKAVIEHYTWHCNRHTFASRLAMAGVDIRTVAQLMGHRTIQMTMRYAHLAPDHQQSAVDRLVSLSDGKGVSFGEPSAIRSATSANMVPQAAAIKAQ